MTSALHVNVHTHAQEDKHTYTKIHEMARHYENRESGAGLGCGREIQRYLGGTLGGTIRPWQPPGLVGIPAGHPVWCSSCRGDPRVAE